MKSNELARNNNNKRKTICIFCTQHSGSKLITFYEYFTFHSFLAVLFVYYWIRELQLFIIIHVFRVNKGREFQFMIDWLLEYSLSGSVGILTRDSIDASHRKFTVKRCDVPKRRTSAHNPLSLLWPIQCILIMWRVFVCVSMHTQRSTWTALPFEIGMLGI